MGAPYIYDISHLRVNEKESRSLCGICDEDEKGTLIYFVEEKVNGSVSIVDGDTDRNFYEIRS
jgi:hypothetical protein